MTLPLCTVTFIYAEIKSNSLQITFQVSLIRETLLTLKTRERLLSSVKSHMDLKTYIMSETLSTMMAYKNKMMAYKKEGVNKVMETYQIVLLSKRELIKNCAYISHNVSDEI